MDSLVLASLISEGWGWTPSSIEPTIDEQAIDVPSIDG